MAKDNEVKIDISIEEKAALKALTKLSKGIDGVEKETKESFSKMDGFVASFSGNLAANLVGGGLRLAVDGVKKLGRAFTDGVAAAQVQEDAVNLLNISLKNAGEFSERASQDFQDFASAMQQSTKFGDEVILQQAALARNFTSSNEEAKKLTKAAIELSSATGMSLDSAVKNLGKTFAGLAGELGESVPALRNLTAEQLKAGEALDFVLGRFGGSAAAEAQSFSGIIAQLSNEYGDFQERLGQSVTESTEAKKALAELKDSFSGFGDIVSEYAPGIIGTLSEIASTAIRGATGLSKLFASAKEESMSLDQVNAEIEKTTKVIEELQKVVKPQESVGFFESIFGSSDENREQLGNALTMLDELRVKRKELLAESAAPIEEDPEIKREAAKTAKMLEERQKRAEAIAQFEEQRKLLREEKDIAQREIDLQAQEEDFARLQEIEMRKLEIKQTAEKEIIKQQADSAQKQAQLRDLELKQMDEKNKLELKMARDTMMREQQIQQSRIQATQNFIGVGLQLAKRGSMEAKALQVTSAIINTYSAANQALRQPPGPPFTIPLVASVIAGGLANVMKIKQQSFATGGVVGGFTGATAGQDNTTANVRTGEMILNANQQRNLFEMVNERMDRQSSNNNQPIVLNVDGREIARVVRDQREQGFVA